MASSTPSLKGRRSTNYQTKVNVKFQRLYLHWINKTFLLYLFSRFRMRTMKIESLRYKGRCQPERCFSDRKINFTSFAFGGSEGRKMRIWNFWWIMVQPVFPMFCLIQNYLSSTNGFSKNKKKTIFSKELFKIFSKKHLHNPFYQYHYFNLIPSTS